MTSYHGWTHAPKELGGTDPIPTSPTTAISHPYGWIAWQDGEDIPNDTVYTPLPFTDWFVNDAGQEIQPGNGGKPLIEPILSTGRLQIWPGNVQQYIWTVTVTALWSDTPPASGVVMVGNLVGVGGFHGNTDVHDIADAAVLLTHANNQAHCVTAVRGRDDRTPGLPQGFLSEVYQNTGGDLGLGCIYIEAVGVPVDYDSGTYGP